MAGDFFLFVWIGNPSRESSQKKTKYPQQEKSCWQSSICETWTKTKLYTWGTFPWNSTLLNLAWKTCCCFKNLHGSLVCKPCFGTLLASLFLGTLGAELNACKPCVGTCCEASWFETLFAYIKYPIKYPNYKYLYQTYLCPTALYQSHLCQTHLDQTCVSVNLTLAELLCIKSIFFFLPVKLNCHFKGCVWRLVE